MNWLNLELTTLRSEHFLGSEPVERATWLCLMAYCADQENGGTISGCGEWGDRKWQQLVGVTAKETRSPSLLWKWEGFDIALWGYPIDKEIEVKTNRKNGKKGGRPTKLASEKPKHNQVVNRVENQVVPFRLNVKEGNRKGIGKEEEEESVRRKWNIKPLLKAIQNRYKKTPDMSGYAEAINESVADGFNADFVDKAIEWLGKQTEWKYVNSFATPNALRDNLPAIYAKSREGSSDADENREAALQVLSDAEDRRSKEKPVATYEELNAQLEAIHATVRRRPAASK